MNNKKKRNKLAKLFRLFGVSWAKSHKLARKQSLTISDLDPNIVKISPVVFVNDGGFTYRDQIVIDKKGTPHTFRDGVLW